MQRMHIKPEFSPSISDEQVVSNVSNVSNVPDDSEEEDCTNDPYVPFHGKMMDCGISGVGRNEFSKSHTMTKSTEKTILPDLEKLDIPNDVKIEAERIFRKLETNTKRGRRRKKLLFYCIFTAYTILNQPKDPKSIAELVDISSTQITKAFSMCSESQTNYKAPNVNWTPIDFIPQYLESCGLSPDCEEEVIQFAKEILDKDPDLYESYPQVVAAGILQYYMTINGAININKKKFADIFKKSEMTISKMYKKIAQIHNS